jgi:hypothetical protein
MDSGLIVPLAARWVHIGCACIALGGPFFVRFGLMPTVGATLPPEQALALREAINKRWRMIVGIVITLLIVTGLYTFLVPVRIEGELVTARWKDLPEDLQRSYQMVFGIKMMAAFAVFFLASVLPGRAQSFAVVRKNAKFWTTVLLLCGAVVVLCGGRLRSLERPTLDGGLRSALQQLSK